jgi:tetratricopeptide (TPR) repeat protein
MTLQIVHAELSRALDLHQRGQLAEAEQIYRSILEAEANHFDAAHLLGVIYLQRGQFDAAEQQIASAIRINPNAAAAYNNRGNALQELNRLNEAVESYDRAIALQPAYPEAYCNRGAALKSLKRFKEAVVSHDKALALKPDYADALNNRGVALEHLKRYAAALDSYDKALAIRPDYAIAFNNRGNALKILKRHDEALASHDRAIALRPDYADAFTNKGAVLHDIMRLGEALTCHDKAIALRPGFAEAISSRGAALYDLSRFDEALACHDKAIALKPDYAEAYVNRAHCKFTLGRMSSAWIDYDRRWQSRQFQYEPPALDAPHWSGENLKRQSILVFAEQGLGDIIQFSRYLPLIAQQAGKVSFLAPPQLHRLFSGLKGDIRLLSSLDGRERFDVQCALMSLPRWCGTTLSNVPTAIPYLSADPKLSARWREVIGPEGFKIGVCWQSKPDGSASSAERSFPLRACYGLSQIPTVRLISLQKNYGLEELTALPEGMKVDNLGTDFDSGPDAFVDTAAVMEHLDLIVTCDTSVAHVAGALGRPTCLALKKVADWRWMKERSDSPWYPTMRLFRQRKRTEWDPVFEEMTASLKALLAGKSG